jgi:TRAP-type C4-dicarboxylate transport system permease small subunit
VHRAAFSGALLNAHMNGRRDVQRNLMDRFIDSIELMAAIFVGIVAADVFISVLLRYLFGVSIPDSYDFGRLLLGILIFWGIGATSYRGTHITVDLLWANVGPTLQRAMDIFATLVLLFVVAIHSWTLFDVAWLGDVSAVVLIAARTYRLIFRPDLIARPGPVRPVE